MMMCNYARAYYSYLQICGQEYYMMATCMRGIYLLPLPVQVFTNTEVGYQEYVEFRKSVYISG